MYWFLIHQLPFPVSIESYTGRLHACNEEMIHSDVHICRCFNWLIRFKLDVKKKIQADLFLNYTYYKIFKLTTIFYSWYVVIIFFKYILTIFDKNTHIWLSEKCNQNWWKGKIFKIFNWRYHFSRGKIHKNKNRFHNNRDLWCFHFSFLHC